MLSDRVATGELSLEAPARALMQPVHALAAPGQEAGSYLMRMLEVQADYLLLTETGQADYPADRPRLPS